MLPFVILGCAPFCVPQGARLLRTPPLPRIDSLNPLISFPLLILTNGFVGKSFPSPISCLKAGSMFEWPPIFPGLSFTFQLTYFPLFGCISQRSSCPRIVRVRCVLVKFYWLQVTETNSGQLKLEGDLVRLQGKFGLAEGRRERTGAGRWMGSPSLTSPSSCLYSLFLPLCTPTFLVSSSTY